jgi:hypothetical protein
MYTSSGGMRPVEGGTPAGVAAFAIISNVVLDRSEDSSQHEQPSPPKAWASCWSCVVRLHFLYVLVRHSLQHEQRRREAPHTPAEGMGLLFVLHFSILIVECFAIRERRRHEPSEGGALVGIAALRFTDCYRLSNL